MQVCRDKYIPKNTCWDVATAADGDHELRLEVIENALSRVLAQLVHLTKMSIFTRAIGRVEEAMDGS